MLHQLYSVDVFKFGFDRPDGDWTKLWDGSYEFDSATKAAEFIATLEGRLFEVHSTEYAEDVPGTNLLF